MEFELVDRSKRIPDEGHNKVYLRIDYWNDFSYITMFDVVIFDENGKKVDIGSVKIGFYGQTTAVSTFSTFATPFASLAPVYFSVGQDVSYYQTIHEKLSDETKKAYLEAIQDLVYNIGRLESVQEESVFRTSLLRSISMSSITEQFPRVLDGGAPITDFDFIFDRPQSADMAGITLKFKVVSNSFPTTNIHAVIGRNGVGKTTLLNDMISSIINSDTVQTKFYTTRAFMQVPLPQSYFSSLVSVSFSAFDPFVPPPENNNLDLGTRYSYIGLKDDEDDTGVLLKSLSRLRKDCVSSLKECFSDKGRKRRWLDAIKTLESDENFAIMRLAQLANMSGSELENTSSALVERMSSGHAVVLLTISRLISRVEEKTLILLDEPESHLHPPLLSAFTRALSELLRNRNGVAIIATHSPVVLQELPKSCVNVITRSRLSMVSERPRIETFGENVGTLTREVFGLEVAQSGYHNLLAQSVSSGGTYEEIVSTYNGQLGLEARGILRAMVASRDNVEGVL